MAGRLDLQWDHTFPRNMRISIFTRVPGYSAPPPPAAAAAPPAPWRHDRYRTEWRRQVSRSTGFPYYFNAKTNKSLYTEQGLVDWWGFEGTGQNKVYVHVFNGERTKRRPAAAVPDDI